MSPAPTAYVITVQTPVITEAQLKAILDLFDTNNAILISLTKL